MGDVDGEGKVILKALVYRTRSTRAYLLKTTPKHIRMNMTLIARMHWTLMRWYRH